MDFVSDFPRSLKGHDTIWVMVARLTKFTHFLPIRLSNSVEDLDIIFVCDIVRLHEVLVSIAFYRDSRFTSLFWKGMQSALGSNLRLSLAVHP